MKGFDGTRCLQCNKHITTFSLSRPDLCFDCYHEIRGGSETPQQPAVAEPDNSHYTKLGLQPWDFIAANNLNFFEGNVVKYIARWREKNGVEDLKKARVYIDELIRREEEKSRL